MYKLYPSANKLNDVFDPRKDNIENTPLRNLSSPIPSWAQETGPLERI